MNKRKVNTMLTVLLGTSLLMGGQAFAAEDHNHDHGSKHKHRYNYDRHPYRLYEDDFANADNQSKDTANDGFLSSNTNELAKRFVQTYFFKNGIAYQQAANGQGQEEEQNVQGQPKQAVQDQAVQNEDQVVQTPAAEAQKQADQVEEPTSAIQENAPAADQPSKPAAGTVADQVIEAGKKYMGTPYKFGSSKNTTSTFDCSSFTQRTFHDVGISLPRDSRQQSTVGQEVSIGQLQKGDLVFFRTSGSSSDRITHVAIYAGNDQLLHTYGSPGVTFSKFSGTNWEKRFVTARRVI